MGGIAVVQNPSQAEFAQMPQSAISYGKADYVASVDEIGMIVAKLAREIAWTNGKDEGLPK